MTEPARRPPASGVWFVTRKYPPQVGGMELLSFEITTRIARRRSATILALRRGQAWLPWFVLASATRVALGAMRGSIAVLHLGDPVLAPVGALARLFGVPVCVTVHGLDVTFGHPLYRLWLRLFFRRLDGYICISEAARAAGIAAGVAPERTVVIGIGIDVPAPAAPPSAREKDLLLFVGRLVLRKGLRWFVEEVLPVLAARRPGCRLAIIGTGPEREAIEAAATRRGVADRLLWLGAIGDDGKWEWLGRASVCIVPNVAVPGDIEGYGITALEAAAAACPLVVADLEGLRDAIVDGEGGTVVPSGDAARWTETLATMLDAPDIARAAGERAQAWVRAARSWDTVCDRYEAVLDALAGSGRR
jgi:phosphatidylinositol alpha-1,6-mannosyltransferase